MTMPSAARAPETSKITAMHNKDNKNRRVLLISSASFAFTSIQSPNGFASAAYEIIRNVINVFELELVGNELIRFLVVVHEG